MSTKTNQELETIDAAREISPEDLLRGDYVVILRRSCEYPAAFTCCDCIGDPERNLHLNWIPSVAEPPYRVVDVCLPFVLVKSFDRKHEQLDFRLVQLGRLPPEYGRRVRKQYRKQNRASSSNKLRW